MFYLFAAYNSKARLAQMLYNVYIIDTLKLII